ncbi:hypothetical protein F506_19050 [Herbaspirillum hiltneri N3]|uniref:Uncharacterized protein n=1 Tax=Herbaspirillum hiltneri N3 TaxID=1262470 RepID=A0ABM5V4S5_9BURK|nr:hypothetical protein [Herbaspirillum hiltneri]AKZ64474.1 hypothetical protein F506_19050 [Herbaspirillum hiltneri N3]
MKQLANQFFSLSAERRRVAFLFLAKRALDSWQIHFPKDSHFEYREAVTGSTQILEIDLPLNAIKEIESITFDVSVTSHYREPIAALQDGDLELPEQVEFAYYGIYNAHQLLRKSTSIKEELILSQLLSALQSGAAEQALHDAITCGEAY